MIKKLSSKDMDVIWEIINKAAYAYKGVIPDDCFTEPYMPIAELQSEMKSVTFFGWQENNNLTGVMGLQPVLDMTLIRHAYILPDHQRKGIGTLLLNHLKQLTGTRYLLVGTWRDATWAIEFYQKHGFKLMPDKDELLARYWDISQRQIDTSVVLGIKI